MTPKMHSLIHSDQVSSPSIINPRHAPLRTAAMLLLLPAVLLLALAAALLPPPAGASPFAPHPLPPPASASPFFEGWYTRVVSHDGDGRQGLE